MFSDVVTTSLDVTGNCTFLSLSHNTSEEWSKEILQWRNKLIKRNNCSDKVGKAGFSVKTEAENIFNFYKNHNYNDKRQQESS